MSDEISAMRGRLKEAEGLLNQKERLVAGMKIMETKTRAIDAKLEAIFGSHAEGKTRRRNLRNYVIRVMAPGAHMKLSDVASGVKELGYATKDKRFSTQLCVFMKQQDDIRRVKYGVYVRVAGDAKSQLTLGDES